MASILKYKQGYRAQVFVGGVRKSRVFNLKRDAVTWAALQEGTLKSEANGEVRATVREAIERYRDEVTPTKRGYVRETSTLNAILRSTVFPTVVRLPQLKPEHIAAWRDSRLKSVKPGTVLRELATLSAVLETARRDWGWLKVNPMADIRKPPQPLPRDRVIAPWEVRGMLKEMGYKPGQPVKSVTQAVAVCFLTALRTGMRAGELCGLTWDRVKGDYCILPDTKTTPRHVALSNKARRLIGIMRGWDKERVFGVRSQTLNTLYRRSRERAGLSGFTFHDTRHTAATMLAQKLSLLDLCKMFGWSNPKQAMVYYNPTASEIARRLG